MRKYLFIFAVLVFAAGLFFAGSGGQTKASSPSSQSYQSSSSTQSSGRTTVQSSTSTQQPAQSEKTFEGTILWLKAADKVKKTSAAVKVMGADNKAMTFVVKGTTTIEKQDKTPIRFMSLKKDEKVMVTYKESKGKNVADMIVVES